VHKTKRKTEEGLERGGEMLATMTVELNSERMDRMKQEVLKVIQRMVDEYGDVSVIELELALIEGLAKVREIGIKQMEETSEESDVV
jgi:septum formation topological specificity factor MinE